MFYRRINFTSIRSRGQFWRLREEVLPSTNKCGSRWYKADAVFYRKLLQQLCGYSDYSFMVSSVHILTSWRYLFLDLWPHNSNARIYTGSHSYTLWEKLILEITTLRSGNFLCPLRIREKNLLASCPSVCSSACISAATFQTDFRTIWYGGLAPKSVTKPHVWLKSDKNIGQFTLRPNWVLLLPRTYTGHKKFTVQNPTFLYC